MGTISFTVKSLSRCINKIPRQNSRWFASITGSIIKSSSEDLTIMSSFFSELVLYSKDVILQENIFKEDRLEKFPK